mgnify:CR=1 FL=1
MTDLPFLTLAQAAEAPAPPAAEAPAPAPGPAPLPTVRDGAADTGTATTPGDTTTQPVGPGAQGLPPARPPASPLGGLMSFLPIILLFVVFWFILMGGQRREKKKRAEMLSTLGKGAKVQTIGGILGTVVEVRDKDVVVKVDENNNTRLRLAKSAIQTVLADKDAD